MTQSNGRNWSAQNHQFLYTRLNEMGRLMQSEKTLALDTSQSDAMAVTMDHPPAINIITQAFGLSTFEEFVLVLCAGYELDGQFAQQVHAYADGFYSKPCFGLAMALFENSHWSATTPVSPLRQWRLLEVDRGEALTHSRLRIDERILHYLTGISYLDDRLQSMLNNLRSSALISTSHSSPVDELIAAWETPEPSGSLPIIQLNGSHYSDMTSVAHQACQQMGVLLYQLDVEYIPDDISESMALARLWQREAILDGHALLLKASQAQLKKLNRFVNSINAPILIMAKQPLDTSQQHTMRIEIPSLTAAEQKTLWQNELGEQAQYINGGLDRVVSQFNLSAQKITRATQQLQLNKAENNQALDQQLWTTCRLQSRKKLDTLAQRISNHLCWDDLVLPEAQKQVLRDVVSHARMRFQVYEHWGFAEKSTIGHGISALFYGPSGTGKTMAASVIANELALDIYRIDLSQVVNKYIGETEKNLARVFDAAEDSGAILLFDEADTLFAKRTEVKTSHDRNANRETSYLLQRMESYSGIAILTTNLKKDMDSAFMRRIRFAIQFPFPDKAAREQIWQRIFPSQTPLNGISTAQLANLDVAGGNIRNIALNAAFMAADNQEAVNMTHLARATRRELGKIEKSIKESELRSWL